MRYLLTHALERSADRFADRDAIRCRGQALTYAALLDQTNRLANLLIDQGVKRGDRVGIHMHKALEGPLALWAVMRAGAAYVPLDPAMPPSRLNEMLADCGIRHLITQPEKAATVQRLVDEGRPLTCCIGVEAGACANTTCIPWSDVRRYNKTSLPLTNLIEQDLAYLIYTSGSTGKPKGIMHSHHSGLSYARWGVHHYGLSHEDRLSNHAPLHFDMSTFDFFAAAAAGGCAVLVPEEVMVMAASYSRLLQDERVSVVFTVPLTLIQLLLRGVLESRDLSALRWIIYGGDTTPTKYICRLMKTLPATRLSHMYGPAETNGCTSYELEGLPDADQQVPIGKAFGNMQTIVVDDHDEEVCPGQTGEMLVRGPTVMLGYWNRPELNDQCLVRRPLAGVDGVFYRTGDLIHVLNDGRYVFVGRKDRQVKVRGYRVELDAIEAALMGLPQVEEAAAYPVCGQNGERWIEATIVPKAGDPPTDRDLIAAIGQRLPSYSVPQRIARAPQMPRTTSDKIDRKALQTAAEAQARQGEGIV